MKALWLSLRLLWQPATALPLLTEQASYGSTLIVAWLVSCLFLASCAAAATQVQTGVADFGAAFAQLDGVTIAKNAAILVFWVAVILTPCLLLIGNRLHERLPAGQFLRKHFRIGATCHLAALTAAMLACVLPVALIGWQGAQRSTDNIPAIFGLLAFLPLPIFVGLLLHSLNYVLACSWASAALAVLLAAPTLILFIPLLNPLGMLGITVLLLVLAQRLLRAPAN